MRHLVRGRQLSRDTEHRRSLRRSLVQSLFENGKIRTTLPKAREVRALAEKLITLARVTGPKALAARRRVIALLNDRRLVDAKQEFTGKTVVQKLFEEIGPKFADRNGGYTRIIKLSDHRIGDGAGLVLLQLCLEESKPTGQIRRSAGLRRRRNERKDHFAREKLKNRPAGQGAASAATGEPARDGAPGGQAVSSEAQPQQQAPPTEPSSQSPAGQ